MKEQRLSFRVRTYVIKSVERENDDDDYVIRCSDIDLPGAGSQIILTKNEFSKVLEKLDGEPVVGYRFCSNVIYYVYAFRQHFFPRVIHDVVKELVLPSLIQKKRLDTRDIVHGPIEEWYMNETRIRVRPDSEYLLDATEWYDYLNTLLPNDIRISALDPCDKRIIMRCGSQCDYFYLKHPDGDCYGVLYNNTAVVYPYEFGKLD